MKLEGIALRLWTEVILIYFYIKDILHNWFLADRQEYS